MELQSNGTEMQSNGTPLPFLSPFITNPPLICRRGETYLEVDSSPVESIGFHLQ
jgi:hypothetical protein